MKFRYTSIDFAGLLAIFFLSLFVAAPLIV
jgi:hypothetical protein